jgi:glucosamine--fructose-6-phosphate aminotransferase (isomerizing)
MRYRSMIASQPESVSRCVHAARAEANAIDPKPFATGLIAVTGIGASFAAAVVVAAELVRRGFRAVAIRSINLATDKGVADSIIALSHRGRSVEVVDALKAHPSTPSLAITNNAQSPLAKAAGQHLRIANETDATPSSTGYTGTLASAGVLIDRLSGEHATDLDNVPHRVTEVLDQAAKKMPRLRELFRDRRAIDCVGARSAFGTAEEASLLLREAARIPAAAIDTRNFLHGPMEAMDTETGVVLFGDNRELLLAEQLREIRSPTLLVTAREKPDEQGVLTVVHVPAQENEISRGIIDILSAQLLAAELSDAAGLTDTKFRYRQTDTKIV